MFFQNKTWIFFILLLGLCLRLYGLQHGYPYSYYPDEAHFVKRALAFGSFDFNPHWFHKPAFYMYVLFFEYGIFFVIGKVVSLWTTTADFAVSYVLNPGPFYLIGRVTTVLFSLGSIWGVFKIGERHFARGTGVFAALFLSLTMGHISTSQDIKADTPTMFFTVFSMLFLLNYVKSHEHKFLWWATIAAGMGTATKTYSIVMLPLIMVGIFIVHSAKSSDLKKMFSILLLKGFSVVGVFYFIFFICSPYNFLDPLGRQATFGNLNSLIRKVSNLLEGGTISKPGDFIAEKLSLLGGIMNYMEVLFSTKGMGVVIATFCSLGVLLGICKKNKESLLLLGFPLLFAAISIFIAPGYAEPRHQLPIYPFLAVFGGMLCLLVTEQRGKKKPIILSLMLLSLFFTLSAILERGKEISLPETRNLAKVWIEEYLPSGSTMLLDENGVQLLSDPIALKRDIQAASLADLEGQFTAHYGTYLEYQMLAAEKMTSYDLHYIRFPWWRNEFKEETQTKLTSAYDKDMANPLRPVGVADYQHYIDRGFQYVVVQSQKYQRFLKGSSTKEKKFPAFTRFYMSLFQEANLIKEFSAREGHSTGPTVKIFKLDP